MTYFRLPLTILTLLLATLFSSTVEAADFTCKGTFAFNVQPFNLTSYLGPFARAVSPGATVKIFAQKNGKKKTLGKGFIYDNNGNFDFPCTAKSSDFPAEVRAVVFTKSHSGFKWPTKIANHVYKGPKLLVKAELSGDKKPVVFAAQSDALSLANMPTNGSTISFPATLIDSIIADPAVSPYKGNPMAIYDFLSISMAYMGLLIHSDEKAGKTFTASWPSTTPGYDKKKNVIHLDFSDGDDAVVLQGMGLAVGKHFYGVKTGSGAPHFFTDTDQKPEEAFLNGHALYWACTVMHLKKLLPIYFDGVNGLSGPQPPTAVHCETKEPFNLNDTYGGRNETAVGLATYDVTDLDFFDGIPGDDDPVGSQFIYTLGPGYNDLGVTPYDGIHLVMKDKAFKKLGKPNITDLWDGWFKKFDHPGKNPFGDGMIEVFKDHHGMYFAEDSSEGLATPVVLQLGVKGQYSAYDTQAGAFAPGYQDADDFMIDLVAGKDIRIITGLPINNGQCLGLQNPELIVTSPSGQKFKSKNNNAGCKNEVVTLSPVTESGAYAISVKHGSRYGSYSMLAEETN